MRFRDRGALDGSGTARITAPLPDVAWAAELGLQLNAVDLSPLAPYIPGAAGLGGRVRAKVTVDLAYAGALTARVRGDVGGARFALADGARTLLSLRSINATGLDLAVAGADRPSSSSGCGSRTRSSSVTVRSDFRCWPASRLPRPLRSLSGRRRGRRPVPRAHAWP